RWLPDGSAILFLSARSGSMQVWKLPLAGGEARQITDEPLDVANLVVSPNDTHIAYTLHVIPYLKKPIDTQDNLDQLEKRKATGRIYDSLLFRHWDTWKDDRRSHIFVRPIDDGPSVDIMRGMDADAPSQPFGGPEEIAFTPQGFGIVFACRDAG